MFDVLIIGEIDTTLDVNKDSTILMTGGWTGVTGKISKSSLFQLLAEDLNFSQASVLWGSSFSSSSKISLKLSVEHLKFQQNLSETSTK